MGAERIHAIGEGDELFGQEDSFRKWTEDVFHVGNDETVIIATMMFAICLTDLLSAVLKLRQKSCYNYYLLVNIMG